MSKAGRQLLRMRIGLVMLSVVALAAGGRVVQLARAPTCAETTQNQTAGGREFDAEAMQQAALREEMARLISVCPQSASIDLDEISQCAAQQSIDASSPVRLPAITPLGSPLASGHQVPSVSYPVPIRIASAANSLAGQLASKTPTSTEASNWLVDPSEWYTEKELRELNGTNAAQADSLAEPSEAKPEPERPIEEKPIKSGQPMGDSTHAEAFPEALPASDGDSVEAEPMPVVENVTGATNAPDYAPNLVDKSEELPSLPPPRSVEAAKQRDAPNGLIPRQSSPKPSSPKQSAPEDITPIAPLPNKQQVFAPPAVESISPPAKAPAIPRKIEPKKMFSPPPSPAVESDKSVSDVSKGDTPKDDDPHAELFAKNCYPSARDCAKCHEKIYNEWSSSSHAYAMVSPMFHKFEQKINELSLGTIGYFCYRCHSPVGTSLGIHRDQPLWEIPVVAREGVTCISCHRVQERYSKVNGERRVEPGPIFAPVFGGMGGDGVAEAIHRKDHFKLKTSPHEKGPGQDIHTEGIYFDQLTKSEFCMSCHQVAVHPGIKLEVVWEQYRASPACKKGIRCQDCHMGRIPGIPSGFEFGPAADMSGKNVRPHRKHSNHNFYGPGYSIAHPGTFPFHLKADRWTIPEWLAFDWRAGWGTDDFEDAVADGLIEVNFPAVWKEADDRFDAREIIDENQEKLAAKREIRKTVMENGSHVDGPFFDTTPLVGKDLKFNYLVTNTNEGHNLLTASLGAQPQLWANVVLIAPDGRRIWETGYTDSYGDVADIHSVDVRNKRLPFDWQLFNLQSIFLITGVKGTDREFPLPVNLDFDQLPFIRPGVQPITTLNHPPFIRMESKSLAALGSRRVPYRVPGNLLRQPGVYRLSFRMRSRMEPIYFMRFVGATNEMQRAMNEGMIDVHAYSVEFLVR